MIAILPGEVYVADFEQGGPRSPGYTAHMAAIAAHPSLFPSPKSPAPSRMGVVPLANLENGDHLDAAEFLGRYERAPHVKKAELVQGVVYVASPVRADWHGKPDMLIHGWLFAYQARHPGLEAFANTTMLLDDANTYQPDAVLCSIPKAGTAVWLEEGYLCGAPELVCEVSASSKSMDLHKKLAGYLKAGVREYLVWRTLDEAIDWFVLENGQYVALAPDAAGVLRSKAFPGLALDVPAALRGDSAGVLAALSGGTS